MSQKINLPVLEPAAQAFVEATANPPFLFDLGPIEGRKVVDEVQSGDVQKPEVDIDDIEIKVSSGKEIPLRIIRPIGHDTNRPLPIILYIHGPAGSLAIGIPMIASFEN